MSVRSTFAVVLVAGALGACGSVAGARAQAGEEQPPLGFLAPLTAATWEAGGEGFSTTLSYRWALPGRVLEATNELRDTGGRLLTRYHGTYAWDPAAEEIVFRTVGVGGEMHEGRAWWKDGVLWHEARVSGGAVSSYASALRPGDGRLEYFAAYGVESVPAELLRTRPLVYRPAPVPAPVRIDGEITIRAEASAVWAALTTQEGLAGWIAPESRVELRVGGPYELHFTPNQPDRGMEGTRVLALIPGEMLATSGEAADTWSVWRLDPVAPGVTRVRFTGLGSGPEWAERVDYFRNVTPGVLDRLRSYVEGMR